MSLTYQIEPKLIFPNSSCKIKKILINNFKKYLKNKMYKSQSFSYFKVDLRIEKIFGPKSPQNMTHSGRDEDC